MKQSYVLGDFFPEGAGSFLMTTFSVAARRCLVVEDELSSATSSTVFRCSKSKAGRQLSSKTTKLCGLAAVQAADSET